MTDPEIPLASSAVQSPRSPSETPWPRRSNGENVVPTSGEETAGQKVEARMRSHPPAERRRSPWNTGSDGSRVHAQTVVIQPHVFDCSEHALNRRCTSSEFGQPRAPEDHVAYGDHQPCF